MGAATVTTTITLMITITIIIMITIMTMIARTAIDTASHPPRHFV